MSEDLGDTIEEAASNPRRMSGDLGSVDERSIDELIKADQYLAQKRARAAGGFGLKFLKISPPGGSGV